MTVPQWLGIAATISILALLMVACLTTVVRRRRAKSPPQAGWLTDDMVEGIISHGRLSGRWVPEEALDLEEIAKEEERFWSETWDESEPYWD
jgi:hypothetical protein